MSMNSKQRWMGGVVLLGGGVLLAALLLKGKEEIHQNNIKTPELVTQNVQRNAEGELVQLQPLTVDVETEKRLLEQQRVAREKSVAEQEARAAEFLAMQQQAEADAARKAAEEYAALNAHRNAAQQSSDNIPPELVEDEKAKQQRIAADKAAEVKKLEQQKLQARTEAEKAAAAKKLAEQKALAEKQALEDKAKREAEAKRKAEDERKAEAKKEAERKARTRHLIQLGALFEIANLDKRDPAELLGILLKTAEIDPNDMKWQIWKDLGQEVLNQRKKTEKQSN